MLLGNKDLAKGGWSKEKLTVYTGSMVKENTGRYIDQILVPSKARRAAGKRIIDVRASQECKEAELLLARIHKHLVANRRDVSRVMKMLGLHPTVGLKSQAERDLVVCALAAQPGDMPQPPAVSQTLEKIAKSILKSGKEMEQTFTEMGINKGSVLPAEVLQMWLDQSGLQDSLAKEESDLFIEFMDVNECGCIHLSQLQSILHTYISKVQEEEKAKEEPDIDDDDGMASDGDRGMKSTFLKLSDEQISKVVDFLDPNKDGEIDLTELGRAFRILHKDEAISRKKPKSPARQEVLPLDTEEEKDNVELLKTIMVQTPTLEESGNEYSSGFSDAGFSDAGSDPENVQSENPPQKIEQDDIDAAIYFISPLKSEKMKEGAKDSEETEISFVEMNDAFMRARRVKNDDSSQESLLILTLQVEEILSQQQSEVTDWFSNLMSEHAMMEVIPEPAKKEVVYKSELERLQAMEEAAENNQLDGPPEPEGPTKQAHEGVPHGIIKKELLALMGDATSESSIEALVDGITSQDFEEHEVVTTEEFVKVFEDARKERLSRKGRALLEKMEKRMKSYGQRLKDLFNEIDTSGDERLNYSEMKEMIDKMNQPSAKARAEAKRKAEKKAAREDARRSRLAKKKMLEERLKAAAESGAADVLHYLEEKMRKRGERVVDLFRDLDVNNNGVISHDELRDGLKKYALPSPRTLALAKLEQEAEEKALADAKLAKKREVALRRKVLQAEQTGAANVLATIESKLQEGAKIESIFKQIDIQGSGHISVESLQMGFQVIDLDLPHSQVQLLVDFLDDDGDGSLDLAEFSKAMKMFKQLKAEYPYLGTRKPPVFTDDKLSILSSSLTGLDADGICARLSQAWDAYLKNKASDANEAKTAQTFMQPSLSGFGRGGHRMPSNWDKMTEKQKLQFEIKKAKEAKKRRQAGEAHWKKWVAEKERKAAEKRAAAQENIQTERGFLSAAEVTMVLAYFFQNGNKVKLSRLKEFFDTPYPFKNEIDEGGGTKDCTETDISSVIDSAFGSLFDSVGQVTSDIIDTFFMFNKTDNQDSENQSVTKVKARFNHLYGRLPDGSQATVKWSEILVRSGCRFGQNGIPRDKLLECMKAILQHDLGDESWDKIGSISQKASKGVSSALFRTVDDELKDLCASLGLSMEDSISKAELKKWLEKLGVKKNQANSRYDDDEQMTKAEKEAAFQAWCKERAKLLAKKKAEERKYLKELDKAHKKEKQELYERVKAKLKSRKSAAYGREDLTAANKSVESTMSVKKKKQIDIALAAVAISPYRVHPTQQYKKADLDMQMKIHDMRHDPLKAREHLPSFLIRKGEKAREELYQGPIFYRESRSANNPALTPIGETKPKRKRKKKPKTAQGLTKECATEGSKIGQRRSTSDKHVTFTIDDSHMFTHEEEQENDASQINDEMGIKRQNSAHSTDLDCHNSNQVTQRREDKLEPQGENNSVPKENEMDNFVEISEKNQNQNTPKETEVLNSQNSHEKVLVSNHSSQKHEESANIPLNAKEENQESSISDDPPLRITHKMEQGDQAEDSTTPPATKNDTDTINDAAATMDVCTPSKENAINAQSNQKETIDEGENSEYSDYSEAEKDKGSTKSCVDQRLEEEKVDDGTQGECVKVPDMSEKEKVVAETMGDTIASAVQGEEGLPNPFVAEEAADGDDAQRPPQSGNDDSDYSNTDEEDRKDENDQYSDDDQDSHADKSYDNDYSEEEGSEEKQDDDEYEETENDDYEDNSGDSSEEENGYSDEDFSEPANSAKKPADLAEKSPDPTKDAQSNDDSAYDSEYTNDGGDDLPNGNGQCFPVTNSEGFGEMDFESAKNLPTEDYYGDDDYGSDEGDSSSNARVKTPWYDQSTMPES